MKTVREDLKIVKSKEMTYRELLEFQINQNLGALTDTQVAFILNKISQMNDVNSRKFNRN